LGAERPARAYGYRRRHGLKERKARLNPAPVREHLLHGFGYAVPAYRLRSVSGHYADDNRAGDRYDNDEYAEVVAGGGYEFRGQPAVKGDIGDEAYERGECL